MSGNLKLNSSNKSNENKIELLKTVYEDNSWYDGYQTINNEFSLNYVLLPKYFFDKNLMQTVKTSYFTNTYSSSNVNCCPAKCIKSFTANITLISNTNINARLYESSYIPSGRIVFDDIFLEKLAFEKTKVSHVTKFTTVTFEKNKYYTFSNNIPPSGLVYFSQILEVLDD